MYSLQSIMNALHDDLCQCGKPGRKLALLTPPSTTPRVRGVDWQVWCNECAAREAEVVLWLLEKGVG